MFALGYSEAAGLDTDLTSRLFKRLISQEQTSYSPGESDE